ncbi:MAG TPA: hypothetical protein PLS58_09290 [Bacteroidales bacterium]|jgi:hypothetical protein|nr:hypothetical protein [Bacteroidales bacterium]HQG77671.1 hypothetical protein [Bacteroidales bacterium]
MYFTGLAHYLIWPAFILVSWFIIKGALAVYERKFPGDKEES